MNGCMTCGKELQIGDRVVWRCEDCARKQMQEYDNKCQRIAELEKQLKNAIVPKFKFMEKVYHINKDYFHKKDWFVEELLINGFEYKIDKRKNSLVMWYSTYFDDYKNYKYQEKDLFTTKEEAQAKLQELQGENNFRGERRE